MPKQAIALRYAVRFRVVFKYLGQLCLLLAGMTLVPLVMSLIFGDTGISLRLITVILGLAAFGGGLARLKAPPRMQTNEGMVIVALILLLSPLVMSYPMMGSGLGFLDAFFEAVSGVTTTGLSTKTTLVDAPPTFLFSRAWMQWYGGLGIVVLSLALVIQPVMARSLTVSEIESDDLVGGTRAHALRVLKVYSVLTVVGIIGLLAVGVGLFDSVLYTFAAVSTGSFSPQDGSLGTLGLPAQAWITILCVAGATPLAFHHRVVKRNRLLSVDFIQLKALIIASVLVSVMLAAGMRLSGGMTWPNILHHAPVLAFSAQTTAGFSSMPTAQLDASSKVVLIFSMLIGGGTGSTAGGFKLWRFLIAVSIFRLIILRTSLPRHAVVTPHVADRRLHDEEIHAALILIVLFITVVGVSWFPFTAMGYDPLDSLFEVVSATATVGLSVGVTNAALPPLLKGILCIDMLLGRLEIIAWMVLLYPGTWFGRRMEET